MHYPLISIIVPVYNRAEILGETIESILHQGFHNWELILVDDHSTDGSHDVLNKFARSDTRISWQSRPENILKGANGCRNYGLILAKGEYIKWVDSDDLLDAHALEIQLKVMDSNKQLKVCFGPGIFFNDVTKQLAEGWSRNVYSDSILWDYVRNNVRWPIGGPLWRKDFFEIPPFEENLRNSQEWLMHGLQLLRLAPNQYKTIDDNIYLIRRGNVRMSSRRNSTYFYNQAKARYLLFKDSLNKQAPTKVRFELIKQMGIFWYHAIAGIVPRVNSKGK
ncbi:MAG: glycosyltransferase family 2 protein [Chryseolinea sp.]